jgi:hypothetical protein
VLGATLKVLPKRVEGSRVLLEGDPEILTGFGQFGEK